MILAPRPAPCDVTPRARSAVIGSPSGVPCFAAHIARRSHRLPKGSAEARVRVADDVRRVGCQTLQWPAVSKGRRSSVQRYHDRVAHRYDESYEDEYWQWHNALTWDYLKPHLPRDQSQPILDLGCGTGIWAGKLLKSGFRVICVDVSVKMLDQARAKLEPAFGTAKVSFVHADLRDLACLPAESAGLAIALGDPIGCAESPPAAMKQIHRLLVPDGRLVATFDNRLASLDHYLELGDPEALARFLRDGRTHWLTQDTAERFPITTYGPAELLRLVETTGFELLEMVGKTVLPLRRHRALLDSPEARRRWMRIEKLLCRDALAIVRASHLQVACRAVRR